MKNDLLIDKTALNRMMVLLALAEKRTLEKTSESKKLARRYASLARSISSHYKVSMPIELRRRICRNCGNFLIPGVNCSVKVVSVHGYLAYTCECGEERHIFYKKKRVKG